MNTHFSQEARQGRLSTVLGPEGLVLLRMDGQEELSGDFEWRVEALSMRQNIDLNALLGTHATVEITHANGARAFDGIICDVRQCGAHENGFRYDLILRPWLHVAGLRRNMRIFHNKTVLEIVREVADPYAGLGNPHLEDRTSEDYPVLEYTVQYGESDADFIRRQLERHGISWAWQHEAGSHTLVLADFAYQLPDVPGTSRPYYGVEGYHRAGEEHFRQWHGGERITTGAVRLTEYNFKFPQYAQEVEQLSAQSHPSGDVESYDWPGDYLTQGEGRPVVIRRLEEEQGQGLRHHAAGDVVSLGAGSRVTLAGDPVPGATGETFLCLKASHRFRAQAYGSGDAGGDEAPYEGAYVLTPERAPFRPERRTTGPRVQGPETAVVVGEGEIDCDEHGRILVRFHWDLEAAHTMRVRVSQNWASKGWGGMVIPRIGMEVIVEHLRGDPDKPIVTGCVYNGKNNVPYPLPENKTKSTFKSQTHNGRGFNELRFEDNRGEEEIYIHGQRDFNRVIRLDDFENIGRNKYSEVKANLLMSVGRNAVLEARGVAELSGGRGVSIQGGPSGLSPKFFATVDASHQAIFDAHKFGLKAMMSAAASGGVTITADTATVDQAGLTRMNFTGVASQTIVGKDKFTHVGKLHQMISGGTTVIASADNAAIEAGDRIDIVCGESAIRLHSDGRIEFTGTHIIHRADRIDLN